MMLVRVLCLLGVVIAGVSTANLRRRPSKSPQAKPTNKNVDTSELLVAFVMFRHGDRTPDIREMDIFPSANLNSTIFYSYGPKALTNEGKRRGYKVGEYLRKRYNGFLSELYLPDEITVRSTDFASTKMSVLAALAALYPPSRIQKWSQLLNWQPIPYTTIYAGQDDLSVYDSCPNYTKLKSSVYELPEITKKIQENQGIFKKLSEKTGYPLKTITDIYYFNNLIQCMENVGAQLPPWVSELRPNITALTNLEFEAELYTTELKKLGGGVTLGEFIDASKALIVGETNQPKVHLYSAHQNSVAGYLAAANVFTKPHQPAYGATVSLELRKNKTTNKYGVMVVYAATAGGPGEVLTIPGCGDEQLCDFDTFLTLTKDHYITRQEYRKQCDSPKPI